MTLSFLTVVTHLAPTFAAETAPDGSASPIASPADLTDAPRRSEPAAPADQTSVTPQVAPHSTPETKKTKPIKFGRSRHTMKVDGFTRSYYLHIPKSFTKEKHVPLIIVLHGGLGDARSAEWDSVMSKQADKDNFVVAYPNGFLRTWNAGQCCGIARVQNINDVNFIRTLIEELESKLNVDADRIYVAGLSNGGMMAYRIASELADVVAAVAPVEGCMYEQEPSLTAPVSVIAFHGMADTVVKYDGGIGWISGYQLKATPVLPTIEYWTKRNQCDPTPIREERENLTKELYTNGRCGTEVCLFTIKDGGHAWPGGRRASFVFDKPSKYVSATEEMCRFFWSHPRRREMVISETLTQSEKPDSKDTPVATSKN
jgi:polyhydroxybutyrate depolymerase